MSSPSKAVKPNISKEDGELSGGDTPKTPLRAIHDKKSAAIDGRRVKDSLQRPRKRQKAPETDESEELEEESSFEGSIISGLKRTKTEGISLRATGLLEKRSFLSDIAIPDRRHLKSLAGWLEGLNDLFSKTRSRGGEHYKDYFNLLKNYFLSKFEFQILQFDFHPKKKTFSGTTSRP